jgi:hypothetical protein
MSFAHLKLLPKLTGAISLLVLTCLTTSSPAEAGHWSVTPTYSGTRSVTGAFLYPGIADPVSGSEAWSADGHTNPNFYAFGDSFDPYGDVTAKSSGSITTTWVWVYDNENDPDHETKDAPPSSVLLEETGSASWTQINKSDPTGPQDGEHTKTVPTVTMGSIPLASPLNDSNSVNGKHYIPKTVSGGTFNHTCAINLEANVNNSGFWEGAVSVNFTYDVHIRAQPYDFRLDMSEEYSPYVDPNTHELVFNYVWKSTTGNLADLSNCFDYEIVDYTGQSTPSFTAPAPFSLSHDIFNPTIKPDANQRLPMSRGTGANDTHGYYASTPPYSAASVTATQKYVYDDADAGIIGVTIPGPDATATIVHEIVSTMRPGDSTAHWYYHASKKNLEVWVRLD